MNLNHHVDKDGTLRDPNGNAIGKVGPDGSIRDGITDKGSIDKNDRYTDQHGADKGWAIPVGGSDSGASGCAFILIIVAVGAAIYGIFKLIAKLYETPAGRKVLAGAVILILLAGAAFGIKLFADSSTQDSRRQIALSEMSMVRNNPQNPSLIMDIGRVGNIDCKDSTMFGDSFNNNYCRYTWGRYRLTNKTREIVPFMQLLNCYRIGNANSYGFTASIMPGQSIELSCKESELGQSTDLCGEYSVGSMQWTTEEIRNQRVCLR